jgi:hypothetical protein
MKGTKIATNSQKEFIKKTWLLERQVFQPFYGVAVAVGVVPVVS